MTRGEAVRLEERVQYVEDQTKLLHEAVKSFKILLDQMNSGEKRYQVTRTKGPIPTTV